MVAERDIARICSWCGAHYGGPPPERAEALSHGICEPCARVVWREWGLEPPARENPQLDELLDPVILRMPPHLVPDEVRANPTISKAMRLALGQFGIRKEVRQAFSALGRKKTIDAAINHLRRKAKALHTKYVLPLERREHAYRRRTSSPRVLDRPPTWSSARRGGRVEKAGGRRWHVVRKAPEEEAVYWPSRGSPLEKNRWTVFAIRYLWELGAMLEAALAGMAPMPPAWRDLALVEARQFVDTLRKRYATPKSAIRGLRNKARKLREGTKTKRGNVPAAEVLDQEARLLEREMTRLAGTGWFQAWSEKDKGPLQEDERLSAYRDDVVQKWTPEYRETSESTILSHLWAISRDPDLQKIADEVGALPRPSISDHEMYRDTNLFKVNGRTYAVQRSNYSADPGWIVISHRPSSRAQQVRRSWLPDERGRIQKRLRDGKPIERHERRHENDVAELLGHPIVKARIRGPLFGIAAQRWHFEQHPRPGEMFSGGEPIPRPFSVDRDVRTIWEGTEEGYPNSRVAVVAPSEGPHFYVATHHDPTVPGSPGGVVHVKFLDYPFAPAPGKSTRQALLDILTLEDEKGPAPSSWEEAPRRIPVPAAHLREIVQTAEQISEIVPFGDLEESPSELFSRANPRGDPAVWIRDRHWIIEQKKPRKKGRYAKRGYRLKKVKDGTYLLFGCPKGLWDKETGTCRPRVAAVRKAEKAGRPPPETGMELLSIKRRPGASGYPKALENLLRQQQHDRVGALLDEPETSHRFHGALAASSDEDLWLAMAGYVPDPRSEAYAPWALEEGGRIRTAKEAGKRAVLANALRDRMPFSEVAGDLVHVMTSEKNRAENKRRYRAAAAAAHPGELLFGLSRLQRQARLLPAPRKGGLSAAKIEIREARIHDLYERLRELYPAGQDPAELLVYEDEPGREPEEAAARGWPVDPERKENIKRWLETIPAHAPGFRATARDAPTPILWQLYRMHKGQLGQATRAKALWSELRRRGREWFKDAPNRQARVKKILLTGDPGAESWQLALAMATKRTLEAVKRAEWDGRGRVPPTVRILEAELETRGTSKMYPPSAWAPASKTRANPLHPKDAEAFALLSRPLETKEDVEAYRELLKQFPPVVLMRFVYSSTAGQGRDLWADTAGRRRWYLLQAELEKKGLLPEEADWWVEALAFLGKNDIPLGPEMATPLGYPTWYQPMGNDVFAHWWGEYQEDPESFVEHFGPPEFKPLAGRKNPAPHLLVMSNPWLDEPAEDRPHRLDGPLPRRNPQGRHRCPACRSQWLREAPYGKPGVWMVCEECDYVSSPAERERAQDPDQVHDLSELDKAVRQADVDEVERLVAHGAWSHAWPWLFHAWGLAHELVEQADAEYSPPDAHGELGQEAMDEWRARIRIAWHIYERLLYLARRTLHEDSLDFAPAHIALALKNKGPTGFHDALLREARKNPAGEDRRYAETMRDLENVEERIGQVEEDLFPQRSDPLEHPMPRTPKQDELLERFHYLRRVRRKLKKRLRSLDPEGRRGRKNPAGGGYSDDYFQDEFESWIGAIEDLMRKGYRYVEVAGGQLPLSRMWAEGAYDWLTLPIRVVERDDLGQAFIGGADDMGWLVSRQPFEGRPLLEEHRENPGRGHLNAIAELALEGKLGRLEKVLPKASWDELYSAARETAWVIGAGMATRDAKSYSGVGRRTRDAHAWLLNWLYHRAAEGEAPPVWSELLGILRQKYSQGQLWTEAEARRMANLDWFRTLEHSLLGGQGPMRANPSKGELPEIAQRLLEGDAGAVARLRKRVPMEDLVKAWDEAALPAQMHSNELRRAGRTREARGMEYALRVMMIEIGLRLFRRALFAPGDARAQQAAGAPRSYYEAWERYREAGPRQFDAWLLRRAGILSGRNHGGTSGRRNPARYYPVGERVLQEARVLYDHGLANYAWEPGDPTVEAALWYLKDDRSHGSEEAVLAAHLAWFAMFGAHYFPPDLPDDVDPANPDLVVHYLALALQTADRIRRARDQGERMEGYTYEDLEDLVRDVLEQIKDEDGPRENPGEGGLPVKRPWDVFMQASLLMPVDSEIFQSALARATHRDIGRFFMAVGRAGERFEGGESERLQRSLAFFLPRPKVQALVNRMGELGIDPEEAMHYLATVASRAFEGSHPSPMHPLDPERARRNPPGKKAGQKLEKMYRRFHGSAPREVLERDAPPGTPSHLVVVGELDHLGYAVPAHSQKAGSPWRHYFGHEDPKTGKKRRRRGERPLLATDAEGKHLWIVGGNYAVRPEGIVG